MLSELYVPEPTYIAELGPADYPRFHEKDPALPATHAAWAEATSRRAMALRRTGARVVLYPISFSDFETYLAMLHINDFSAATRNCYAADMAAADRNADRL